MKNAILPSVSSQLYSFGNSIETISNQLSGQMDSKVNVYTTNSFCFDSNVCDNYGLLGGGGFATSSQSLHNYQLGSSSSSSSSSSSLMAIKRLDYPCLGGGYLATTSSYDCNPHQPLSLISKNLSVPHFEADDQFKHSGRKRSIEVSDVITPRMGLNNVVGNKTDFNDEWTTYKKRRKSACLEEQWHVKEELIKEFQSQKVPVRRSQKLSDRITALQKLVSPYGKTDTASVLQEASISIKVLQDEIQNMLQTLSTSYISTKLPHSQKIGEKQLDLRCRGLCLVPLSFTQKLTQQNYVDQHTLSNDTFTVRNS